MGHTFTNLLYHIIFSTKKRYPFITPDIENELYKYMSGIARNKNGRILKINGVADHIHILAVVKPSISLSDFIRTIKANSSGWVHKNFANKSKFEWQVGYASFSVSESQKGRIIKYIESQKEHHSRRNFPVELSGLLKKHRVEFDPLHYLD